MRSALRFGFILALLAPELADACAVCFSGTEENRDAFNITAAMLTFTPLAMIGGAVFWVRSRYIRHEREQDGP